jgi:PKD repeat protein
LRANNFCLPNTAPLAVLNANVDNGLQPLAVNFNASASSDPDTIDTIARYTFNFGDGGDDVTQASPTISHTFNEAGEYIVRLVVTDSRGKVSSNTAQFLVEVSSPLSGIVSHKVHAFAGPFDINLPLGGTAGIECRSGGANKDYTITYTFARSLAGSGGITATVSHGVGGGTGSVSSQTFGPLANQYTVNVTNISNAQHLIVTLNGVHDIAGALINNSIARMDLLLADTTADRSVNSADIGQTKSQSGHTVTSSNFREVVTVDGSINSAVIGLVKSKSGTALP